MAFIELMHIRKTCMLSFVQLYVKYPMEPKKAPFGLIKSRNRPVAVQPTLAVFHHVEHQEACLYFCGNYTWAIWMSSKCLIVRPYSPMVPKAPQPRPKRLLRSLPRPFATTGNRLLRTLYALDSRSHIFRFRQRKVLLPALIYLHWCALSSLGNNEC